MTVTDTYLERIGSLIRDARRHKGLTQSELARSLGTSQSAVARIEQGQQNLSLETLARIGESLDSEFVSLGHSGPQHLRIVGGQKLHGAIDVKTSKNAARRPALRLPAQPGPHDAAQPGPHRGGQPDPRGAAPASACAPAGSPASNDLELVPPTRLDLGAMDVEAARRTRSVIMFLGPLLHDYATSCCRTPAAATSAPAPSSRTSPRCGRFGLEVVRDRRVLRGTVDRVGRPDPADRAHRARRHRHRERAAWPPRGTTASP